MLGNVVKTSSHPMRSPYQNHQPRTVLYSKGLGGQWKEHSRWFSIRRLPRLLKLTQLGQVIRKMNRPSLFQDLAVGMEVALSGPLSLSSISGLSPKKTLCSSFMMALSSIWPHSRNALDFTVAAAPQRISEISQVSCVFSPCTNTQQPQETQQTNKHVSRG